MKTSLQVGRIAGVPLQFHWSFLLVGLWLAYDSWVPGYGFNWDNFQWLLVWISMVFLAVLLHELGHALVARRWGIETEKIVLYPIGGGAFLEKMPEVPREEISIALAGPAVNFFLAGLMVPIIWYSGNEDYLLILQLFLQPNGNFVIFDASIWEYLVVVFFALNLLLGAFNLIPAFPLDGGRVLRAVLSKRFSRTRATVMAGRIGMWGGAVLLAAGIYLGDVVFAVGAVLIFSMAAAEIQVQRRRERLSKAIVRDYLRADFQRLYLSPRLSLAATRALIAQWPDQPILLLDQWQQPHGITSKQSLLAKDLDEYADNAITTLVGQARWEGLHPEESLLRAAEKLDEHQLFAFPVLDHYGRILGLLDRTAVERVIQRKK
ncbi:M50 family metallopeptidase [Lewinella sp. LCG006]|uniref:M50 family metallopeptidase n=1 Tax=Lewinella sp. LCG006 TaxID=3231911 RepID=UPI0034612327